MRSPRGRAVAASWYRLRYRIGRRGGILLFFAGLDAILAVGYGAPGAEARKGRFFIWLADIAPLWLWASLWAIAAVLCLVSAFRHSDRLGFVAAMAMNLLWGVISFGAWAYGVVERGYLTAAIFLGFAGLLGLISGWRENPVEGVPPWTAPPA